MVDALRECWRVLRPGGRLIDLRPLATVSPVELWSVDGVVRVGQIDGSPGAPHADNHYFSLKKIFPSGRCSPVILNYELMNIGFAGGEITKFKIHDDQGKVIEVISTFVNKDRDQWAIVGSKTVSKVIFCLYASSIGKGSVDSRTIRPE